MGTPRSTESRPERQRPVVCLVKLCSLVVGLPFLFTVLLDWQGGLVAGLITLVAGVLVSIAFTWPAHKALPDPEVQLENV